MKIGLDYWQVIRDPRRQGTHLRDAALDGIDADDAR